MSGPIRDGINLRLPRELAERVRATVEERRRAVGETAPVSTHEAIRSALRAWLGVPS